jgi:tetratricopeptide (TPR) repeat protein
MKRFLPILLIMPFLILHADMRIDRESLFKKGISAYASEDYHRAQTLFHQLEQYAVSWELYYNLGNAYYRDGKLGRAIQYWEKARMLAPAQPDIHYNLTIAEQDLIDKVVLPEMFPLFRWYRDIQQHLPLNILIIISGLLVVILVFLLGYGRLYNRRTGKNRRAVVITFSTILLSLILLLSIVTIDTNRKRQKEKYAVILDRSVNVLSEPLQDASVLFILHEGSKVRINKQIEDEWANISYFDDKIGWVNMKSIGKIQP